MEIDFRGKRALITGGAKGIGKATAEKLLQCKARVIALDIDQSSLDALKSQHPEIETALGDVSDWKGTKEIIRGLGPIDLLVNNAGIIDSEKIGEITEESLSRILDVNLKSVFNISQIISNDMKARGSGGAIVNLSSVVSATPVAGFGAYCVSKAGITMLSKILSLELGPHKIRVNAVSPTLISSTAMGKSVLEFLRDDEKVIHNLMEKESLKTTSDADNIAEAIVFLLSERASTIHGINLPVDAGFSSS